MLRDLPGNSGGWLHTVAFTELPYLSPLGRAAEGVPPLVTTPYTTAGAIRNMPPRATATQAAQRAPPNICPYDTGLRQKRRGILLHGNHIWAPHPH
jgi:hypothetical protein